jgi:hypothetical protein
LRQVLCVDHLAQALQHSGQIGPELLHGAAEVGNLGALES